MSEEEWCEHNDMPKSMCAHCQGTPELDQKEKPELDVIILAKHDGFCPVCGDPIVAGDDHIGRAKDDGAWVHYGCGQ